MGCEVVAASHPSSDDSDMEFRFSFSKAESVLFETLSEQQKNCYLVFKALIQRKISKLRELYQEKIE